MSSLADTLFPPDKDPFRLQPAAPVREGFAPWPSDSPARPVGESPAAKSPSPLPNSGKPAEAAPAPPQAKQPPSLAEVMFPENAMDDATALGINPESWGVESAAKVDLAMPAEWLAGGTAEDVAGAKDAFFAASLPQEMISDLTASFMKHAATPVTTTEDECLAELRRVWGDKMDSKLELAHRLVMKGAEKWPKLIEALQVHGSGNDPTLIRKLASRAEVLQRQGKL